MQRALALRHLDWIRAQKIARHHADALRGAWRVAIFVGAGDGFCLEKHQALGADAAHKIDVLMRNIAIAVQAVIEKARNQQPLIAVRCAEFTIDANRGEANDRRSGVSAGST